jgi:phosphoenolpyruvate phosphomutase
MNKAQLFRERLAKPGVIRLMGAHSGLGARLIARYDFEGIWASGLEISAAHAQPDANILTMTEYLAAASEISDACELPVIADCDTGYGNSNNVMYAVQRYEAAGIAGICVEDKHFPKVNSYVSGRQELAPIGEFVGKIMAAKNSQTSEDFVLIARVEALIAGWGQDEAIKRAEAYADAGADLILMHSKSKTDDEIREFLKRWDKRLPVVIVPTTYPGIDLEDLEALGVKVVIYANHGLRAAVHAMDRVFAKISNESGIAGLTEDEIVPMSSVFELQGMVQMKEAEKRYLRTDAIPTRAVVLAAGSPNNESLSPMLGDRPVAMLDINGKSLLQRTVETLNTCGVQDVTVVGGYQHEAIDVDGVEVCVNDDFATTRATGSFMRAEIGSAERIMAIHGDTILDRRLLQLVMEAEGDVVLVCDDSYKRYEHNRDLELVALSDPEGRGIRKVDLGQAHNIFAIGSSVEESTATHEYVGIVSFSRKAWEEAVQIASSRAEMTQWNIADLVAELISRGLDAVALPVNSGWKEIHTFEHYREACAILK